MTICSGLDLVNINYTPMIAADPDTARVGSSKGGPVAVIFLPYSSSLYCHYQYLFGFGGCFALKLEVRGEFFFCLSVLIVSPSVYNSNLHLS